MIDCSILTERVRVIGSSNLAFMSNPFNCPLETRSKSEGRKWPRSFLLQQAMFPIEVSCLRLIASTYNVVITLFNNTFTWWFNGRLSGNGR